ncbi:MAG TPA: 4-hydroxyphenylacetate 3-hydroxylase C-terminal domain-containing protein [Trebonia sp.]
MATSFLVPRTAGDLVKRREAFRVWAEKSGGMLGRTYLQAAALTGAERVRLFRLVWDTCASAFASRQALYEYYFFSDPVRTASAYVASYDVAPYTARVRAFLTSD